MDTFTSKFSLSKQIERLSYVRHKEIFNVRHISLAEDVISLEEVHEKLEKNMGALPSPCLCVYVCEGEPNP